MQKAKAEAEEVARQKSETIDQLSESREASAVKEEREQSTTPKPETTTVASTAATSMMVNCEEESKSKKHQKTKSESAGVGQEEFNPWILGAML